MDQVVLVNSKDEPLGTMEKLEAHHKGLLHRAFSVLIFNHKGELLIQKRAKHKYHCGGLWTNTCCSHQRLNEESINAGKRRLQEEMGFTTELVSIGNFIYRVAFPNGLIEHELDHVLIGNYSEDPNPNKEEVEDWRYVSLETLNQEIKMNPNDYTYWFKEIMNRFKEKLS